MFSHIFPRITSKKSFFLFIIHVLFGASSFSQSSEIDSLQTAIDRSFHKEPAVAGDYLVRLLDKQEQLHDTITARAYNKLGVTHVRRALYKESFPFYKKAIEKASGYPELQAEISVSLATAYRSSLDYAKSLEILADVLQRYEDMGDKVGIATVYGEMASNYNYMLEDEKAVGYLQKGIEILEQEKNVKRLAVLRQKLANSYFNNGNFNFAKDLYGEVLPVFKEEGSSNYYYTLLNYGDCLFYLEDLSGALENFKIAEIGLRNLQNEEFSLFALSKVARVHNNLGNTLDALEAYDKAFVGMYNRASPRLAQVVDEYLQLLNSTGNYSKALSLIDQFNSLSNDREKHVNFNYRDRLEFLQQSYFAHKGSGNLKQALALSEKVQFLKDSISSARNEAEIAEIQEKYQNQIQKQKNTLLEQNVLLLQKNISKKNGILLLGITVFLLLSLISWFFFKRMADKDKLRALTIEVLDQKKKILEQKHRTEETKRLEKEQLLEVKQREMIAVSIELANIQQKLKTLLQKEFNPENPKALKTKLSSILNGKNYWNDFQIRFTEIHPQFYTELKEAFPSLTKSDLQFCSFMRLGLTNKEIATLLGISPQSVITRKYRIKKKINISEDQDFEDFLKQVSLRPAFEPAVAV